MSPILVITNLPDKETALKLANKLISKKLAACINIQSECTSCYRWKDKIETTTELPIFIKTISPHYVEVENTIIAIHPDELPEIVTVPINGGLPKYLQWISNETTPSNRN
tara:strand:- start:40433 stop:40762 length:330 start_codon:yes stop_codon:yes gene_type:complete